MAGMLTGPRGCGRAEGLQQRPRPVGAVCKPAWFRAAGQGGDERHMAFSMGRSSSPETTDPSARMLGLTCRRVAGVRQEEPVLHAPSRAPAELPLP